jgi:large conductance mechanosensitive channel
MIEIMDERSFVNSAEFKKYRKFAFRDDMMKLSAGVILANSFNKVVQGTSDYLIMPVASYAISKTGSEWRSVGFEPLDGLRFEVGRIAGVFVDFLAVSIILYLVYIKLIVGVIFKEEVQKVPEKQCPHCFSKIHAEAKKCPMCTGGIVVKKRRIGN